MKSWREAGGGVLNGVEASGNDSGDDMEMDVPVQLVQLPGNEGERTNRKNLSKFLGLDDSDSEEIVFIQNRRSSSNNNSKMTNGVFAYDDSLLGDDVIFDVENNQSQSQNSLVGEFVQKHWRCHSQFDPGFSLFLVHSIPELLHFQRQQKW